MTDEEFWARSSDVNRDRDNSGHALDLALCIEGWSPKYPRDSSKTTDQYLFSEQIILVVPGVIKNSFLWVGVQQWLWGVMEDTGI